MKSKKRTSIVVMTLLAAMAIPAQATVVFTPVNMTLPTNGYYAIDLNHDGIADSTLRSISFNGRCPMLGGGPFKALTVQPGSAGGIVGASDAAALVSGVVIDFRQSFFRDTALMYEVMGGTQCPYSQGNWVSASQRYLGLEFQINGQTHYGWAELTTNGRTGVNILYGFAYETIAGKAIKTGQTMDSPDEPDIDSSSAEPKGPGPTAPAAPPTPDTPQLPSSRGNGQDAMATQNGPSQDHKTMQQKYKLYDVGTFGGPGSNFSESQALFNRSGTLVGYAETTIPDPYSPNCFDPDCLVAHAFQFRDGVLTDLGALPGVNNSVAESLNDFGLVVGGSDNGLIDPLLGTPQAGAVGWKNGEIFSLGTLGGYQGFALAVNNSGQATGVVTNTILDQYSFLGGTQSRAFLWQDGVMQDLGTLGGPDSFGQFNNDRGQVAGFSYTSSMPGPSGLPPFDPFIWERGKGMKDLGNFGGTACNPFYFNNRGELVGSMNLAGDQAADPFLWDGQKLVDLGGFGGSFGQGNWVNEAGDVVGFGYYSDGTAHGALWAQGKKIKDLGTLAGDRCSDAWGINSTGRIVGVSWAQQGVCNYPSATITAQHAVIWENGSIVDLNTRIASSNSNLQLVLALEINDRGEIAGFGLPPGVPLQDFEFHGHVFVLVPCDENSPGDCNTGSANAVATTTNYSALPIPSAESVTGAQNQLRNPLMQRYHIPGQPAGPSN